MPLCDCEKVQEGGRRQVGTVAEGIELHVLRISIQKTPVPKHTHKHRHHLPANTTAYTISRPSPLTRKALIKTQRAARSNQPQHISPVASKKHPTPDKPTTMPQVLSVLLALVTAVPLALTAPTLPNVILHHSVRRQTNSTLPPEALCDWDKLCQPLFQGCVRDCDSLRGSEW